MFIGKFKVVIGFIVYSLIFSFNVNANELLFEACKNGDYDRYNNLSNVVTNWNIEDSSGNSPLVCTLKGYYLLQRKTWGKRPIHYAIINNDIDLVKYLIENNCNLQVKDESGITPYILARKLNYSEILDLIEIKIKDMESNDDNALEKKEKYLNEKEQGYFKIIDDLLERGVDVNRMNQYKETALYYSVLSGNLDLVQTLVSKGANVNIEVSSGYSPILIASKYNFQKITEFLLSSGANIDSLKRKFLVTKAKTSQPSKPVEKYVKPVEYNVVIEITGLENNPDNDSRSFYELYIDKIKKGRTAVALDSQHKEIKLTLPPNRHLLRIEKYSLDAKKEKYIKLNNILQPDPNYYYFDTMENRILKIKIIHDQKNRTATYESEFLVNESIN